MVFAKEVLYLSKDNANLQKYNELENFGHCQSSNANSLDENLLRNNLKIHIDETEHISLLTIRSSIEHQQKIQETTNPRNVKSTKDTQTPRPTSTTIATYLPQPSMQDFSTYVNREILHSSYSLSGSQCDNESSILDHGLVMERVLAVNTKVTLPLILKTLPNDLTQELIFSYAPEILQKMSDPDLEEAEIAEVAQNPDQTHLFAAALATSNSGAIALYSLKNPVRAERIYRADTPAVSVNFSGRSPNLLAVGFLNGLLWVIDVSSSILKKMHQVRATNRDMFRVVQWWTMPADSEILVCAAGSHVYSISRPFLTSVPKLMMSLMPIDSQRLLITETLLTLGPAVTCLVRSNWNTDQYLVGGSDGHIRLCSIQDNVAYLKLIEAHSGIVSDLRSVPHCDKTFVTCGSDGIVKLWTSNIDQPVVTLHSGIPEPIIAVCWSPLHATVVVAASTSSVYVWDIRRRANTPVAKAEFSYHLLNLQFSACGEYLVLGTQNGQILFVGLKQMTFPENFKDEAFNNAVQYQLSYA